MDIKVKSIDFLQGTHIEGKFYPRDEQDNYNVTLNLHCDDPGFINEYIIQSLKDKEVNLILTCNIQNVSFRSKESQQFVPVEHRVTVLLQRKSDLKFLINQTDVLILFISQFKPLISNNYINAIVKFSCGDGKVFLEVNSSLDIVIENISV